MPTDPVLQQMDARVRAWQEAADQRSDFLRCYSLMTGNMLQAIEAGTFHDPDWVSRLLRRFADYYWDGLERYESSGPAPPVWQHAHTVTCERSLSVLQRLFVGINAHINYDLVLALVDLLDDEWPTLDEAGRRLRYQDHCGVNEVIGATVDAVQDTVVEPAEPLLDLVDKALGPLDEWMASRLITEWREDVWQHAVAMLEADGPAEKESVRQRVERTSLGRARRFAGD